MAGRMGADEGMWMGMMSQKSQTHRSQLLKIKVFTVMDHPDLLISISQVHLQACSLEVKIENLPREGRRNIGKNY